MQVAIQDAVFEGSSEDDILMNLITLTMSEIATGRHLFDNPLDEPILYARHLRPWVKQSVESYKKLTERTENVR